MESVACTAQQGLQQREKQQQHKLLKNSQQHSLQQRGKKGKLPLCVCVPANFSVFPPKSPLPCPLWAMAVYKTSKRRLRKDTVSVLIIWTNFGAFAHSSPICKGIPILKAILQPEQVAWVPKLIYCWNHNFPNVNLKIPNGQYDQWYECNSRLH